MKHPSAQDLKPLCETARKLIQTLNDSVVLTGSLNAALKIISDQLGSCDVPFLKQEKLRVLS